MHIDSHRHYFLGFTLWLGLILPTTDTIAQEDYSTLFTEVSPKVVTIKVFDSLGSMRGQGSGFIISKEGIIATCLHVVDRAEIISIAAGEDSFAYATSIVAIDQQADLALLQCKDIKEDPLTLAKPPGKPGQPIVAIGSPLGMNNTISTGIISGIRSQEDQRRRIQFTNPISGGSSGGPLLSVEGRVLGLVTSTERSGQNLNFGTSVESLRALLEKANPAKPFKELEPITKELREKVEGGKATRAAVLRECAPEDVLALDTMIGEAIEVGVDVYNGGNAMGCFRVYEGTAYKILNKLGERSEVIRSTLNEALNSIDDSMSADSRAWAMRAAFDSLLGMPTRVI